jgi:putative ABC transport system permease protein
MIRLSGRLRSAVIIGLQGIRARKLRTFLSIISLFLGVLAVVVVQAAAEAARTAALTDVELQMGKDGTLQVYLPADGETLKAVQQTVADHPNAVMALSLMAVIGEPNVTALNAGGQRFEDVINGAPGPFEGMPEGMSGPQMICNRNGCYEMNGGSGPKPPGQAVEVQVLAISGDVTQFRPFRPQSGQWLDFSDAPALGPRLVLNKDAAKFFQHFQLPAEMHTMGATHNMTPQLIGVTDDGQGNPNAYMRLDELLNWLPTSELGMMGGGMQLYIAPESADLVDQLRTRLAAINPEMAGNIHVETIRSHEMVASQLNLLQAVFLSMAALVLLIGVAGILNVGLATVGERVEEFALRRAVGTPRVLLAGIVLAETLLIGLLTAAAAIGLAALALDVAGGIIGSRYPSMAEIAFPWQAGVAGIVAGLVAGILGGLIPAIRAARIPIATVMRA